MSDEQKRHIDAAAVAFGNATAWLCGAAIGRRFGWMWVAIACAYFMGVGVVRTSLALRASRPA